MAIRSASQMRLVFIVLIVLLLMATFWRYVEKHKEEMLKTALAATSAEFSSKLLIIHSQWLLMNKPLKVVLKEQAPGSENAVSTHVVKVNNHGWPDLILDHDACARIWQQITGQEMKIFNKFLFAIELKNNVVTTTKQKARICRYQLNERLYIEYNSLNGKIITKN